MTTHGACSRDKRLYIVWDGMIRRCEDPGRSNFQRYGGRGITVCKEWHDPVVFMDWAYEHGYERGLQLDRINNEIGYCPDNCRFVTPKENCRNRRNNRFLSINGQKKTVAEWAEILPISQYTIYWWLREFGEEECVRRVNDRVSQAA